MDGLPTLRSAPGAPKLRPTRSKAATPSLFPPVPTRPFGPGDISNTPCTTPPGLSDRGATPPRVATPSFGAAERTGIARLAANSPLADAKRGTEYFLLPVKSILNRCNSDRVPFEWTINPYRGCEFACRYCYARYTHEYMDLDAAEFDNKIFAKQNAGPLAARDLATLPAPGEHIAIGTATDPYQPAEREFGATRAILEQIAARRGLSVSITTKSDQVVRDIPLLQKIAAHSDLSINITVTTLRPRLARLLEPRAPRPDLRLAAVRKLRDAGLHTGVFAMPVLPGLTDREPDLDALVRAARDAGAEWFGAQALFLMPASRKTFFAFLNEKFPRLAAQYVQWYARAGYAPEKYRDEISALVKRLRAKYRIPSRFYLNDKDSRSARALPGSASHNCPSAPQLSFALTA